ncbi:MAG: YggT family protein [Leptolyngbya sp. SIO1E4]|nr:YggT family protein [Leptolyngbya sp. SIO1E4]
MSHSNNHQQKPDPHQPQRPEAYNADSEYRGYSPEQAQYHAQEAEAQRLRQEGARVIKARRVTLAGKLTQMLSYLVGVLELLLGARFLLRLTAANPDNTFASFIYSVSRPFVSPFSTLFISPTFNGSEHIFDVNVLVAMAAYLVLLFLVIWQIRILANR